MKFVKKLFDWYFTKKTLPYWSILLLDCIILYLSYLFVYIQFYGIEMAIEDFSKLSFTILIYMIFYIIGFRIFKTYSGILRYSSFVDLEHVGYAMMLGGVLAFVLRNPEYTEDYMVDIRGAAIGIASILATFMVWGIRMFVKIMYEVVFESMGAKKTFIYGVKNSGIGLAKDIRNEKPMRFKLRGFVTDDTKYKNYFMMGVNVYMNDKDLMKHIYQEEVSAFLISSPKINDFRNNYKLQENLIEAGIKIYLLEQAKEWNDEDKKPVLKEVDIEDLLPREQIDIDMERVGEQLTGKSILITGAAGSIGSEIVRQVADFNPSKLVLVDQAETPMHDIRLMMANQWPEVKAETIVTSICNKEHMESLFAESKPDYVFHAAAYKHVPMMEDNPAQAVQNNVYGTRVIADLAVKYGTKKFVMISTDKAVNPTNVMGCSKRICEIYVQSLDRAIKEGRIKGVTQFVTTRFGNVLGSNGSVIPLFREQIKKGGPLTVTHPDIIRYFMLIPEACKLVLEAGTTGHGGEIFIFDMGQPVKIADLAKRMIKLSGVDNIEIKYTGLRDGEKLFEEVLNDAERTVPTHHPKIKIALVREYDYDEAKTNEDRLYKASFNFNDMETVRIMKEIVPEFKSKHSKYEALDIRD